MPNYSSQIAYAEEKGVSKQYIGKLVKQGVIKLVKGKVDREQADKAIEDNKDPAREEGGKTNTFNLARTAKEIERAKIIRLERMQKEGSLVSAADILSILMEANVAVKSRMRSLPSFLPLDIATIYGDTDTKKQREVQALLNKSIDEILEELSDWKLKK